MYPSTPLRKMATPAFVSVAQPAPVAGRVPVARHAPQAAPGESIGQAGSTADFVISEAHIVGSWNVHAKVGIYGMRISDINYLCYLYMPIQVYLPRNSNPVSQEMNWPGRLKWGKITVSDLFNGLTDSNINGSIKQPFYPFLGF